MRMQPEPKDDKGKGEEESDFEPKYRLEPDLVDPNAFHLVEITEKNPGEDMPPIADR